MDWKEILNSIKQEIDNDLSPCGTAPLAILSSCLDSVFSSTCSLSFSASSTSQPSQPSQIQSRLEDLIDFTNEKFYSYPYSEVPTCWRRLYTDAVILKACSVLTNVETATSGPIERSELASSSRCPKGKRKADETQDSSRIGSDSTYLGLIKSLDLALIIAGSPGINRKDYIYHLIKHSQSKLSSHPSKIQKSSHPLPKQRRVESVIQENLNESRNISPPTDFEARLQEARSSKRIPSLELSPSMMRFQSTYCKCPFIIRNFAKDWPALEPYEKGGTSGVSKWASSDYLVSLSGPGRVVPVEIGGKYTDADWKQDIIRWEDFLEEIGWKDVAGPDTPSPKPKGQVPIYLAQHTLLSQFPDLSRDMVLPDYIYSCPEKPNYMPDYEPPFDDEAIVSVWIGPENTYSPAHTDPYFNCYIQVVGHKQVWIAPPSCDSRGAMSTFGSKDSSQSHPNVGEEVEDSSGTSNYMKNTSRIDIFDKSQNIADSIFKEDVESVAMTEILNPGDLLFFPPKWFHGMRSLTKSFSVSMWF